MAAQGIVETPRLVLRRLTYADFAPLCTILQDIEVMYAWEHAFTDAEVAEWIEKNLARYERDGYGYWAVILRDTSQMIGVCGLLQEQADGETLVGVGYIFARAFWHQGYALEAARGCMEYAVQLGITVVTAQIRPENTASRRVAERLGMRETKTIVKEYRGKKMPHLLYKY